MIWNRKRAFTVKHNAPYNDILLEKEVLTDARMGTNTANHRIY